MISSTRSSESASRSSWNEASSVIALSSTPSCSVRTSLTRSYTSSRDAAMSPHVWGRGCRGAGCSHAPAQILSESADDVILDAAGREPDRVRDRAPGGVSVGDHGEASQAEQVGAPVGVRVEAVAELPRPRPDQQPAELSQRSRGELLAEGSQQARDRSLEELEGDVAGEAVGHDDLPACGQEIAAFRVAREGRVAR